VNIGNTITSILARVPPSQRRQLKRLYERMPRFGLRSHYGRYGEDAFLQEYFRQQLVCTTPSETMLPGYLQRHIGAGYYVDVGAHAPVMESNTYWFYKRGWCGINIDAAPGTKPPFQRQRPRDITVEALISDSEAELTFYYWDTPFGVNTLTAEHARYMAKLYGREPQTITTRSRRLDSVLSEHLPAGQQISFLTVDVEGHDLPVLRSNDWHRFRPELVLVEDFRMTVEDLTASQVYRFMRDVGYEMYAWLRPTVVYRQMGRRDWLVPTYD
jgi:FkbM family methyltransferase